MLNVSYRFKALQPIHTGSDTNLGTLKTLRREKVCGVKKELYSSYGFTKSAITAKHNAIALLILKLWDRMENKSRYTIYEEISSKLLSSTYARSKYEFLQFICDKFEIRDVSETNSEIIGILGILNTFDDDELLDIIRTDSMYIVALFRNIKEKVIEEKKKKSDATRIELEKKIAAYLSIEPVTGVVHNAVDYIPVISGNSIRGMLRRICMYDFCKTVGITKLSPKTYHMLFTGGTLSAGDGFEDISKREEMIQMCPMLGLFGSAIGTQTIQGELRVGQAKLVCSENGTGSTSYHDLTNVIFGTRLDSSKNETDIEIVGEDDGKHQMKYEYEVYCVGAEFNHNFACTSDNEIIQNSFYHMLKLFIEHNYIAGKSSIGHGEIDNKALNNVDGIGNGSNDYIDYLSNNDEKIRTYWENLNV